MSGYYPPGVTGNEPYFTGEWECARCDEPQDGNAEVFEHPETGDPYCTRCHEFLVETGRWPVQLQSDNDTEI